MLKATRLINDITSEKIKVKTLIINPNTGKEIGYLSPITFSTLDDISIAIKMSDWRNKNSSRFLTKFTATPERTKQWLKNSILSSTNRLMFLMYCKTNNDIHPNYKLIGHLGFFNLTDTSAEGDATIRGEHGGGVDFMKYAAIANMDWFFTQFKPRDLICRILSDNESAINMAFAIGYEVEKEVNLYRHGDLGSQDFEEVGDKSQLVLDKKLVYLKARNPYSNPL
jgi:RimJ/RimL family protein N-acetyltransferase